MKVDITFAREKRCSHSLVRECTPCFKDGMWKWMGISQFHLEWAKAVAEQPEELIDSLTVRSGAPL